jgi:hypothetical protein
MLHQTKCAEHIAQQDRAIQLKAIEMRDRREQKEEGRKRSSR